MSGNVQPIPDGYHTVTPYLIVRGAAAAIAFYEKAFGAVELMRMPGPDGRIGHAEIRVGDSPVMLADENPAFKAPGSFGGSPVSLMLYVPDVDATVARAVSGGAKIVRPVENQFYGDRMGGIEDPFGHQWYVATHVEDVSPEEMRRRSEKVAAAK
ncbi:MAG TPA: VOC family protein [Thermoanaerobaculia bacterium]|nr:VOC family protein [Thermoanaerobaculia bacterium]